MLMPDAQNSDSHTRAMERIQAIYDLEQERDRYKRERDQLLVAIGTALCDRPELADIIWPERA
jgi:hypothetical protein